MLRIYCFVTSGSDHNFLRHFSADCDAGVLHLHNDIASDGVYHRDLSSHNKTEVLQINFYLLLSPDFSDNVFLTSFCLILVSKR